MNLVGIAFEIVQLFARARLPEGVLLGVQLASFVQAPPDLAAPPPSITPTFLQLHFTGAPASALTLVILVFLFLNLLDASGTLTAVGQQAGLIENGKLRNGRKALVTDAGGSMVAALLGTSPVTAYIESAAGAGGRTGLVAVTVAVLFLAALFLAPLAGAVPAYATAPALVFVAVLFARDLKEVDWVDVTEALPALVTALAIPLTFSIAEGIGLGFLAYCVLKLLTGRWREIGAGVAVIAIAFIAKVALA